MTSTPVFIPQTVLWLLRLAAHPSLTQTLQRDPVAFAAWYAAAREAVQWPTQVADIQSKERGKRLSLDRMMKLLSQVNYAFAGRTNAQHARLVLEGYAVHQWVREEPREFVEIARESLQRFAALGANPEDFETVSPFAARLAELGRTLNLSRLEQDILAFAFLVTVSDELSGIFEQLSSDRWTAGALWPALFDTSKQELSKTMRPNSPLRLSGLLLAESAVRDRLSFLGRAARQVRFAGGGIARTLRFQGRLRAPGEAPRGRFEPRHSGPAQHAGSGCESPALWRGLPRQTPTLARDCGWGGACAVARATIR